VTSKQLQKENRILKQGFTDLLRYVQSSKFDVETHVNRNDIILRVNEVAAQLDYGLFVPAFRYEIRAQDRILGSGNMSTFGEAEEMVKSFKARGRDYSTFIINLDTDEIVQEMHYDQSGHYGR